MINRFVDTTLDFLKLDPPFLKSKALADWEEEEHPRDEAGKFTESGGTADLTQSTITPTQRYAIADQVFTKGIRPTNRQLDIEAAKQARLIEQQKNPLAHPELMLGQEDAYGSGSVRYITAYGREFQAQKLPAGVERGTPQECYRNASMLVMTHPELTYVEGYAKTGDLPFTFLHAWAVDRAGKVIDNTWDKPEQAKYFGVKYDRAKYLKSLYKQKVYGVVGAGFKPAQRAVLTGGSGMRVLQ